MTTIVEPWVLAKMAETDASKCYLDKQVFVDMMSGQCCDQLSGCDMSALDWASSDQHQQHLKKFTDIKDFRQWWRSGFGRLSLSRYCWRMLIVRITWSRWSWYDITISSWCIAFVYCKINVYTTRTPQPASNYINFFVFIIVVVLIKQSVINLTVSNSKQFKYSIFAEILWDRWRVTHDIHCMI